MATYVKTLKDATSTDTIYPITKANAVYLSDNSTTVETELDNKITIDSDSSGSFTIGYDAGGIYVITT